MSDGAQEIKKETRGGFRPGAGRPKGARNSRPRSQQHSDAIEASKIEKLLSRHYSGDDKLSPTQLKAIEIRYSRLRPTLASVEQTVRDDRDSLSPDELLGQLRALFAANPGLLERLLEEKKQEAAQQSASTSNEMHVTH